MRGRSSRRPRLRLAGGVALCAASAVAGALIARATGDALPPRAHARYEAAGSAAPMPEARGELEEGREAPPRVDERAPLDALGAIYARGKIITGETPHRLLLFSFDDGPDLRTTPRLLDVLDRHGIRAVFFLNSGRLQEDSERGRARARLAREIAERGHLVGDHTVDHALLTNLPDTSVVSQLEASQAIFTEVFGARPWLFRPPGGARTERVDALVAEQGYTQVLWNLGAPDHELRTPEAVLGAWRRGLEGRERRGKGGGIVLLHDTHEWTVDAVPRIVEDIEERNCELLAAGEPLYDIVDDPAVFFAHRDDAPPHAEAPAADPDPSILEARQARLRREAAARCAGGVAQPEEAPTPAAEPAPAEALAGSSDAALAPFYSALAELEAGERSLVRVTHVGDSGLTLDQLPHYLRRKFQQRFGDGGAGFVPVQPATSTWRNRMVDLYVRYDWKVCSLLDRCEPSGRYGLAGLVAESRRGALTRIGTLEDGDFGRSVSRVELWYGAQPRGGTIELRIDDAPPHRIDTEAARFEDRWRAVEVEPGSHDVTVRAAGGGPARVYGVVLESEGPGVVWDTISMSGAFTSRLLEQDAEHFVGQLRRRGSDLLVLHLGGNDLRRYLAGAVTPERFEAETRRLLERARRARPEMACLVTGISDHGKAGPVWVRPEHVQALVEAQRSAARAAGCAFFDTFAAMGGAGSIHDWVSRELAQRDMVHLTPEGRRVVAGWLYDALMAGYARSR